MRVFFNFLTKILLIVGGAFLISVATNAVLVPNELLAGGLTGIATFLYYLFDWNISRTVLLLNIPLFLVGFILLDKRFMFSTLFGLVTFTLLLKVTQDYTLTIDHSLAVVIVAGLLNGCGCGMIYHAASSLGGSDIVAKIIHHYFSFNMATVTLIINALIILCSIPLFGIDLAMLTLANMYLSSKVTNFFVDGIYYRRTLCITTSAHHAPYIGEHILKELHRHVTLTTGTLLSSNQPCTVLYTTVALSEVGRIKKIVKSHDSQAFITLNISSILINPQQPLLSKATQKKM